MKDIEDIKDILIFLYQERYVCSLELKAIEQDEIKIGVVDEAVRAEKLGQIYMLSKVIDRVRPTYEALKTNG